MLCDGPRAPRYRSRHCKFPTCPTRISQLSHRIQRDPRLYIIYSYFHAPAFIVKRVIRSVFPRVSGSLARFPPFFSFRVRYPRDTTISCFQRGKRRLWKILSVGNPSLSPTTELLAYVSFSLPSSLYFSLSSSCLRKASHSLQTIVKAAGRIRTVYINN